MQKANATTFDFSHILGGIKDQRLMSGVTVLTDPHELLIFVSTSLVTDYQMHCCGCPAPGVVKTSLKPVKAAGLRKPVIFVLPKRKFLVASTRTYSIYSH